MDEWVCIRAARFHLSLQIFSKVSSELCKGYATVCRWSLHQSSNHNFASIRLRRYIKAWLFAWDQELIDDAMWEQAIISHTNCFALCKRFHGDKRCGWVIYSYEPDPKPTLTSRDYHSCKKKKWMCGNSNYQFFHKRIRASYVESKQASRSSYVVRKLSNSSKGASFQKTNQSSFQCWKSWWRNEWINYTAKSDKSFLEWADGQTKYLAILRSVKSAQK